MKKKTSNILNPSAKVSINHANRWALIKRRLWKDRYIYLMLSPVVIYFLIFKYWPMLWLRVSFYDYKLLRGFSGSEFVGFKHYIDFFTNPEVWKYIANTVILNSYALIFLFPASILFALLLNEMRGSKYKRFVQTVSYMPNFISTVVLVSLIVTFLSPSTGSLGIIMKSLHLESIYFLGDPKYFRAINVISGIWQTTGWSAIIYLAALSSIDGALYEAAVVDGAGRFKQMWHITLPGIKNTVVIMLILQLGNFLGSNFEKVFLLQNDLNLSVSEVLATYVYKVGIQRADYSFSTAIGLFNSVVCLCFVLVANRLSRKYSDTGIF